MGAEVPKQFLLINGRPIIFHTIDKFLSAYSDVEIIVVLPPGQISDWDGLIANHKVKADVITVEGGSERFDSIKNALSHATGDIIAIHDAVRPFVSLEVIEHAFTQAEIVGAVVPVVDLKSSIRKITFDESEAVDRKDYRMVQTPQVFKSSIVKLAYEQEFKPSFTDDATVVEACGHDIILIQGNEENIKITTPVDLKLAEVLITEEK